MDLTDSVFGTEFAESVFGVLPTVVSPGAIWAQVEPGLESEALLANSVKHGWSESTELLITVKNWDSRD